MKLPTYVPPLAFGLALAVSAFFAPAFGQEGSYVPPTFSQGVQNAYATAPLPQFPASPLAGGPAAAAGGQYMDASGKPIILPANYCQSCPRSGYDPMCPGGPASGFGDPMAVDFGGYGQDQIGPHYFDVSAGVVYLMGEKAFNGLQPFSSLGAISPQRFLDPVAAFDEYQPGWQIAARLDIGPLSVFEATYMGLYDLGFKEQITAPPIGQPDAFSLSTVFSGYGTGNPNPLTPGFDQGEFHELDYDSDLQSTELSVRRYWVGNNPRISGTWLAGFRYIRLTEDLNFDGRGIVNGTVQSAHRRWAGENDMVGTQIGGDGWIGLRQGLRIGCEGKVGVYNNRFRFRHQGDFPDIAPNGIFTDPPADFDVSSKGNQVAFAAEGGVTMVADILPSWSLRGGYQVLYMSSLATVGNNVDAAIDSTVIRSQADALYHGFHGGLEAIW